MFFSVHFEEIFRIRNAKKLKRWSRRHRPNNEGTVGMANNSNQSQNLIGTVVTDHLNTNSFEQRPLQGSASLLYLQFIITMLSSDLMDDAATRQVYGSFSSTSPIHSEFKSRGTLEFYDVCNTYLIILDRSAKRNVSDTTF